MQQADFRSPVAKITLVAFMIVKEKVQKHIFQEVCSKKNNKDLTPQVLSLENTLIILTS